MAVTGNVLDKLEVYGVTQAYMSIEIVAKITDYLDSHGISNAFVADKIGMTPQALGQTLLGKRKMTVDEYRKICAALEKDLSFFMEEEGV